jgi:hypothetical protein
MRPIRGLRALRTPLLAGSLLFALPLAGCHGGGGSSPLPGAGAMSAAKGVGGVAASTTGATASFSIFVPAPSAAGATPLSIAVTVSQVNGTTPFLKPVPFTINLTSKTTGCAPLSGGALQCTIRVPATIGNDTFTISTFTGLNGSGHLIATSQANNSVASDAGKPMCTPKPSISGAL